MTLPSNWTIGWLGELATEVRNGISLRPDSDRGQPILRISAVRPMNLDTSDIRFLPGSSAQWSPYRLHLDDLLFTRYNGNPHLVGVCARVQAEPACQLVYPDKLIRVRVDTAVAEPAYVEKVVNTGMSRAAIEAKLKSWAGWNRRWRTERNPHTASAPRRTAPNRRQDRVPVRPQPPRQASSARYPPAPRPSSPVHSRRRLPWRTHYRMA